MERLQQRGSYIEDALYVSTDVNYSFTNNSDTLRSYGILGTGLLIVANSNDIGSSLRVLVVSSVAQFVLLMGTRKRKQPEHVDAQSICNILLQNIPQADAEAVPERTQQ